MDNIYISGSDTNTRLLEILQITRKSGSAAILWGEPGIGKTELIKTLAHRENLRLNGINPDDPVAVKNVKEGDLKELFPLRILIGATIEPTELQGLPALETVTTNDGKQAIITRNTMPSWLFDLVQAGTGVLFLDELTSASPAVQAALLSLLQGRMVGQYKLPNNVWIVSAANPADIAVNGFSLPSPVSNRLLHIYMEPDANDFLKGFRVGWGKTMDIAETSLRKEIADFLNQKRHLIQKTPDNDEEAGGAWPSRRSWENAASNMALTADYVTQELILTGFVGVEASSAFFANRKISNLPTTEEIIRNGVNWNSYPVDALLQLINQCIVDTTADNQEQIIGVFTDAAKSGKGDIAYSQFGKLMDKIKSQNNGKINPSLLAEFFSVIKEDTQHL